MRVFLAIDVTSKVRRQIAGLQESLRKHGVKAKWIRPQACHLTVLFLGDQEKDGLDKFSQYLALRFASFRSFKMQQGEIGTFGRPPRILYMRWDPIPDDSFDRLVDTARDNAGLAALPLPESASRKKNVPHLTLARFKSPRDAKTLRKIGRRDRGQWRWTCQFPAIPPGAREIVVDHLTLYASTLTREGAVYEVIQKFPLATV